jgi:hypothetical protein
MTYKVSRYPGSEGVVSNLLLRPSFRGRTEALVGAYKELNSTQYIQVSETGVGSISFRVPEIINPALAYATYEVFDAKATRVVGSIEIPVLVSGR